jgi:hypothetical protein
MAKPVIRTATSRTTLHMVERAFAVTFRLLPRKKGGREWDGGRQDFAADGRGKTSAVGEVQTDRNFRANIVPYSDHFMERGL